MPPWLHIFTLELAVLGIALLVLLCDALSPLGARALGWLTAIGLVAVLVASFAVELAGSAPHGVYVSGAWVLYFQRLFLCAGILGVLGSIDWLETRVARRPAEYLVLLLASLVGMMLLAGVRDWVLLVVAFELMGIPLYVLCAYAKLDGPAREPKLAAEAGLKLFVTGAASTALTLFGLALVVGASGSSSLDGPQSANVSALTGVGMLLVLAGFGFKIGAAPFHMWIPDTYQGAPTPFVAFLSVAPKAGGLAALVVVLLSGWSRQHELWAPALAVIAAASMAVGNLFALPQKDARRLLGYSGIAQMGYVLVALCARSEQGIAMAIFFIASYVFTNFGVFLVVHAAAENSGGHSLDEIAGLSRRSPWLGAALLVFVLSLAGIPFAVGFWAKLFVLLAAYQAGLVWLVVTGVVLSVVALFYYLSVARSTFMADGRSAEPVRSGLPLRAAIVLCLAAVVGLGLWPGPLLAEATRAASAFAGGP
ncbi:MAG: NADH-quinone oxidoreductase subunit N [Planctomycetota bacterium]|nr:NADH-quinone oxidoreductase subunit N [Planctomycetota bacterium]